MFDKKVAIRKSPQQLQTELGALQDALSGLKDAEISLAKTDFAYQAEIDATGRLRTALAQRATALQSFIDQQNQSLQQPQNKRFW